MKKSDVSRLKKVAKNRALAIVDGTGYVKDGKITSTNLEVTVTLQCDIKGEGVINLADIEKPYSDAWIDGGFLFVKRNGAVMKSATHDATVFPKILTPPADTSYFNFDQSAEIKTLSTFTLKDEDRPAMGGVFIGNDEMTATDAHRLMWVKLNSQSPFEKLIIPALTASVLGDWSYQITADESNAFFVNETETVSCRLIDGRYPNYKSVIPVYKTSFICNRKALVGHVENALQATNKNTKAVALIFKNNIIRVEGCNLEENKEYAAEIAQSAENAKEVSIAFNGKLLLSVLQAIKTEIVSIKCEESKRAAIFNDNVLLMPVMHDFTAKPKENPSIQPEEKTVENTEAVKIQDQVSSENESPQASVEVAAVHEEEAVEEVIEDAEIVEEFPSFEEDASSPITHHPSPITQQPVAKSEEPGSETDHPSPITQKPNVIIVQDFTPKSFIVIGETAPLAEQFEKIYGKFTRNLRIGDSKFDGFWFSNKRLDEVKAIIQNA